MHSSRPSWSWQRPSWHLLWDQCCQEDCLQDPRQWGGSGSDLWTGNTERPTAALLSAKAQGSRGMSRSHPAKGLSDCQSWCHSHVTMFGGTRNVLGPGLQGPSGVFGSTVSKNKARVWTQAPSVKSLKLFWKPGSPAYPYNPSWKTLTSF